MEVITEAALRALRPLGVAAFEVPPGAYVTAEARRYAQEQGIALRETGWGAMSRTPIDTKAPEPYVDAETGAGYAQKPENMTHLRGNLLVPKTHPRIALRGQLDLLQGHIILLQAKAAERRQAALCQDLGELLAFVRAILAAEVKEEPMPPFSLLGLDAAGLRRASHDIKGTCGMEHPVPDYRMGALCAGLNLLRAQAREAELWAARAFETGGGETILLALNRLSSAVYLLFCKEVKNHG